MRVALVHDWLTGMRGGEYVLEAIAELFPDSELFTLIAIPGKVSPTLSLLKTHTSWLQKIPGAESKYRHFLPLMPKAIESFDLSGFDLILSSSHCVAKGVRKPPGAVHLSYVHAPMRYIWDRFDDYFGPDRAGFATRTAATLLRSKLQRWDRNASSESRVDLLMANSRFIADQIQAAYSRSARVVNPFADLSRFRVGTGPRAGYLMVGAFAPYKRVDLAIEAFNQLGLPLSIVGGGQDEDRLRSLAGPTVKFLGALSNPEVVELLATTRALIFPGKEDFGITPLEALASGTPVVAFGEGGILDTLTHETGIFFEPQSAAALSAAVTQIENGNRQFDPAKCRARAEMFSKKRFKEEFMSTVRQAWVHAGKNESDFD